MDRNILVIYRYTISAFNLFVLSIKTVFIKLGSSASGFIASIMDGALSDIEIKLVSS